MLLLLEIATEAVCAKYLKRTEEYKQRQTVDEVTHRRHLGIVLQRVVVFIDEFPAQLMGILRAGLPEERGEIVVIRTLAPTLIVDEPRITIVVEHHVASLEITVEETLHLGHGIVKVCRQILGEEAEVGFQFQLMEVEFGGLQETVLEIVQVEEHTIDIKLRLGIAVGVVKVASASNLHIWQLTDGATQQFLFFQGISTACLATTTDGIEKGRRTKIGLQITQLIVTGRQYLRNGKFAPVEVLREVDKSMILITAGTDDTDDGLAVAVCQTVVRTITATARNLLNVSRLSTLPLPIEVQ